MNVETDHVCEAVHCVACCPVARSYGAGYDDAVSVLSGTAVMRRAERDGTLVAVIGGLLVVAVVAWLVTRGR